MAHACSRVLLEKGQEIGPSHLPDLASVSSTLDRGLSKERIVQAMSRNRGNATHAAESLGILRVTLYRACKQHGLVLSDIRRRSQRRLRATTGL